MLSYSKSSIHILCITQKCFHEVCWEQEVGTYAWEKWFFCWSGGPRWARSVDIFSNGLLPKVLNSLEEKKKTLRKSCFTDVTTFDPVMVLWLMLARLHLLELTGRIGQSARGTRQFCWSARDATCQTGHPSRAGVVWPEANLIPRNRRIPLADWPASTDKYWERLVKGSSSTDDSNNNAAN